tara:strand:- start:6764 stop:7345 length:582 start_codon:yes stop_codon:yes gene_type:complete
MFNEQAQSKDFVGAALATSKRMEDGAAAKGYFTLQCLDKDGKLKWEDVVPNLVVNVGLQDMNANYFKGSAYTAAWYIGLYGAGASSTPAAGDTAASHAGWTEVVPYSNATRPAATFGTATTANPSVQTNSASPASFTINATSTVGGAFLISNSTKSGTTGILFSASDFTSPGDRAVVSGDTLNVTYTFSLTAT